MTALDATHDPARTSWVASANRHSEFPIQNLPFGSFSTPDGKRRVGIAIGNKIVDLSELSALGWLDGSVARDVASQPTLNALMALGAPVRQALRRRVSELLDANGADRTKVEAQAQRVLHDAGRCTLHLPADIGDFTDFYAGIHHATNASRRRNPTAADPLNENYRHVPVAYHSRASSVRPSGYKARRPHGQRKGANEPAPTYGPSTMLDFEAELGVWIGPGNSQGEPISIARAADHIWGYCLLNDCSARDIQRWETLPLGPFLGKNFATVVSPWVITPEALAPFRVAQRPRPAGDPRPLPYLWDEGDQAGGAIDLDYEVFIRTPAMQNAGLPAARLTQVKATELYWTPAQMVAHHTSGGCNLRPGDLFGSGTISGPTPDSLGSLMELTKDGSSRLTLPNGETRGFLENGDEVTFLGHCRKPGRVPIGFGACTVLIAPALQ